MSHLVSGVLALSLMAQPAAPSVDPLTPDGFRAWLNSAGALEAHDKLIHDQMQQRKPSLPPWWPDDVYAQEEVAQQKVDYVDAALPFYQACMTDTQARLLAKITTSKAGQQVVKTAQQEHSEATLQGSSSTSAQAAGENAAIKTANHLSEDDKQKLAESLTPAERKMAAKDFSVANFASFRQCFDKAYAGTVEVMKARQTEAVQAVIEANHAELVAAKTKWVKEHPDKTP